MQRLRLQTMKTSLTDGWCKHIYTDVLVNFCRTIVYLRKSGAYVHVSQKSHIHISRAHKSLWFAVTVYTVSYVMRGAYHIDAHDTLGTNLRTDTSADALAQ